MAITLEEYVRRLQQAETTTFPRAIRTVMVKSALTAERESKLRATGQGGPKVRTGRLRSSIKARVRGTGMDSEVVNSADTPYARLQEKGGTIRPVRKKWLTIPMPIHRTSAGVARSSAPNTPGLFFYTAHKTGQPFLARAHDDGTIDLVFMLKKKVEVPARPYLRPGIEKARRALPPLIHAALVKAVGVPGG